MQNLLKHLEMKGIKFTPLNTNEATKSYTTTTDENTYHLNYSAYDWDYEQIDPEDYLGTIYTKEYNITTPNKNVRIYFIDNKIEGYVIDDDNNIYLIKTIENKVIVYIYHSKILQKLLLKRENINFSDVDNDKLFTAKETFIIDGDTRKIFIDMIESVINKQKYKVKK